MGLSIFKVIYTRMIPQTQDAKDRLYTEKISSGEWHEDTIMGLEIPDVERKFIRSAVKEETQGKYFSLSDCRVDMSDKIPLPIVMEMHLEYLIAMSSDILIAGPYNWLVMKQRMLDLILSTGIRAVGYPVTMMERNLFLGKDKTEAAQIVEQFDRHAHVWYQMLHLLDPLDLFCPDQSDQFDEKFVLRGIPSTLPPFFRVTWGMGTALIATEEGKQLLEQAELLGVGFEQIDVSDPVEAVSV